MARQDEPQRDEKAPARVFKSGDVHRRRVNRKGQGAGAANASRNLASGSGASVPSAGVAADAVNVPSDEASSADKHVVISPEFGRRSEEQRKSDDRWFAAMREREDGFPTEYIPSAAGRSAAADETAPLQPMGQDAGGEPSRLGRGSGEAAASCALDLPDPATDAAAGGLASRLRNAAAARKRPDGAGAEASATEEPLQETTRMPAVGDGGAQGGAEPEGAAEAGAGDYPQETSRRPRARALLAATGRHKALVAVGVIVLVLAVAAALFTWNRWYRFDDHADLQGQWYVVGTAVPVTIDEQTIQLTGDVAYQYQINPQDKTISYTFGPMSGQGRYWFSDDRQYLVITDGDEFTSAGTAFDDLLRMFADLPDKVTGADIDLPQGQGIIAFSRTPDADALAKQEADAAAKAAAEEAARKEEERRRAEEEAAWEDYYYYEEEDAGQAPAEGEEAGMAPEDEGAEPPEDELPADEQSPDEPPADESGYEEG